MSDEPKKTIVLDYSKPNEDAADVALQKAKLEFINDPSSKEKTLPYFWAASILTGKVDIIKSGAGFPWGKFLVATVLLCSLGYFIRKRIGA